MDGSCGGAGLKVVAERTEYQCIMSRQEDAANTPRSVPLLLLPGLVLLLPAPPPPPDTEDSENRCLVGKGWGTLLPPSMHLTCCCGWEGAACWAITPVHAAPTAWSRYSLTAPCA